MCRGSAGSLPGPQRTVLLVHLPSAAGACKNDPQCQGFAWTTINGLITLGDNRCFLGRFRTTQTPMTPCLMPADFNLNAYLGLTLACKSPLACAARAWRAH